MISTAVPHRAGLGRPSGLVGDVWGINESRILNSSLFAHALPHRVNLVGYAAPLQDASPRLTDIIDACYSTAARVTRSFDDVVVYRAGFVQSHSVELW